MQAPRKSRPPRPRPAGPDSGTPEARIDALEKSLAAQTKLARQQEKRLSQLSTSLEAHAAALQALAAERQSGARVISSFFLRDWLWILKTLFTGGLRTGLVRYRDFVLLKKSGAFDPLFYARQLGNTTFSDATLLRHYLSEGFRRGLDPAMNFSAEKYLAIYPDVQAARVDPFAHYLRRGQREYRIAPPSSHAPNAAEALARLMPVTEDSDDTFPVPERLKAFIAPAEAFEHITEYTFTRLMEHIWASRADLQMAMNLGTPNGRRQFATWFVVQANKEYDLIPRVFPRDILRYLKAGGGGAAETALALLGAQDEPAEEESKSEDTFGANLIGYAFGEFGMGEHVRMVARALHTTPTPFAIIDQSVGMHGTNDKSAQGWVTDTAAHTVNLFHVNADLFPFLYFRFGDSFFASRHNIGYWAWELAECPPEFELALGMVDEVWAISDFVAEAFRTRAQVPVVTMPLAVTVPELDAAQYTKARFGLPKRFAYLFVFDAASFLDRKNPVAALRAFRQAFPTGKEKVQLVLKTMNTEAAGPMWHELLAEIGDDPRVTVLKERLSRDEVFGLYLACDAFVSLHRSEGFGRGPAEAMAYGRPVVCTNYSGTRDFAHEGTACVVDYTLVPVPEGAYPFSAGQVWADPDVGHAATLMRKLFDDKAYRAKIAAAGQKHILENFNERVIGQAYAARIAEVEAIRAQREAALRASAAHPLSGALDTPVTPQSKEIADVLFIQGWVMAEGGVERMSLTIDGEPAGEPHHGVLRPDVQAAFPDAPDAARSGFFTQVDVTHLSKGPHVACLTAHARDGRIKEWRIDFTYVGSFRYLQWLEKAVPSSTKKAQALRTRSKTTFTVVVQASGATPEALDITFDGLSRLTSASYDILVVAAETPDASAIIAQYGLTERTRWISADPAWATLADTAAGEAVIIIDAGDILAPFALEYIGNAHDGSGSPGLVYADEDVQAAGGRTGPKFKPAWSPWYLEHHNYIGRPWSVSRSLLKRVGTCQSEHDLLRTLGKTASAVAHVPNILCSRPPATGLATPVRIRDVDISGETVSIIIPTCVRNPELVARCFDGLVKQTHYRDVEIILVANNLADPAAAETFFARWPQFKVVHAPAGPFNWSALNNFGTKSATGDLLLYLNDDVEPIGADWLGQLVASLKESGAAIAGPLLLYPNKTIQHLGIDLVDYGGGARHVFRFCAGDEARLQWIMAHPREVSGVTGACLLTTRAAYEALGGFDETIPVACNDVDFCLKARAKGWTIVIEPRARLYHHEGVSRAGISESDDVKTLWKRWGAVLKQPDPFTNPNIDRLRDDWMVDPDAGLPAPYRIV